MIELKDVTKRYVIGDSEVYALDGVSLRIADGDFLAVIGPSGSGKSTLMNIMGCLDLPDGGEYLLDGLNILGYSQLQLAHIRSRKVGFVFQGFNLISKLNALENVELPLIYQNVGGGQRRAQAMEALARVGLSDRMRHRPTELSGGQQQRVAIARAIVANPSLILADEPTGNLDSKMGNEILGLFQKLHDEGSTIVIITHDAHVAQAASRRVHIMDGKLAEEEILVGGGGV